MADFHILSQSYFARTVAMEWVIANGGVKNIPLYNCRFVLKCYFFKLKEIFSSRSYEDWTKEKGVPHPISGVLALTYGIIVEVGLY